MKPIAEMWNTSFCRALLLRIRTDFLPCLYSLFFGSFLWECWVWIDRHIVQSRTIQYLFNPVHLTNAWYASYFYQTGTRGLRKLSLIPPAAALKWRTLYIGIFLCGLAWIPSRIWSNAYLLTGFAALAILYFSHHGRYRTGVVFALVNVTLTLFWILTALATPFQAVQTLTYLLLGIDLFFLVSFAIRTEAELRKMLRVLYLILSVLCAAGFLQNLFTGLPASASLEDNVTYGEMIVLMFPFAMICPLTYPDGKRRILYFAALLVLGFLAVTACGSKAALVGFFVELFLLVLLLDWRYLPLLAVVLPVATASAVNQIMQMWRRPVMYGSLAKNIYYGFRDFWNNGFGINRRVFMDVYQSTALEAKTGQSMVQLPYLHISPLYFTFLVDMGTILLIGFLSYLLRLAHSTLTSVFTAQKQFKMYFAAGFVTLIGISASSMLESTLFNPRVLLLYWPMLGLIRAARIVRFGIIM